MNGYPESSLAADKVIRSIDNQNIGTLCQPRDEMETAAILAEANLRGQSVIPIGGATHLYWGNPPRSADIGICLNHLNQVLAYHPEDMLVTVQAGCPFPRLQEVLATRRQFLPIDPFHSQDSTLGGLAALNAYGPMRLHHGRLRDHILGMRVVTAEGTRTKCGGQVVKNVSGYDLSKFYAGSMGWLGVFTEFHLKTAPLPESIRHGHISHPDLQTLQTLAQKILDRGLSPRAQVLASTKTLSRCLEIPTAVDNSILAIQFAGHPETVSWQCQQVSSLAYSIAAADWQWEDETSAKAVWHSISHFGFEHSSTEDVVLKWIIPYPLTIQFLQESHNFSQKIGWPISWLCHAGSNLLWMTFSSNTKAPELLESMAQWLRGIRSCLRAHRGELILVRGPRALKDLFEVWGVEGKSLQLMLEIKKCLDPKNTLNPGRFVGRH